MFNTMKVGNYRLSSPLRAKLQNYTICIYIIIGLLLSLSFKPKTILATEEAQSRQIGLEMLTEQGIMESCLDEVE
jgi:hypothetical protein